MADAEMIKPYLDMLAERLRWSKPLGPLKIARVREILRRVIRQDGLHSVEVGPVHDALITRYLDDHEAFERFSDTPAWVLRVKRVPMNRTNVRAIDTV
jgi:hypothetical protein